MSQIYTPQYNTFDQAAINKIAEQALKSVTVERTPLVTKFNHGDVQNGSQFEEDFFGLLNRHSFNPSDSGTFDEIYGIEPSFDDSFIHKNIFGRQFKLSTSEVEYRKMLTSQNSIESILSAKVAALRSSENYEEFKDIKAVLESPVQGMKYPYVAVGDVASDDEVVSKKAASKLARTVKGLIPTLTLPNRLNLFGVENTTPASDLVLLISPSANANIDTNFLSGLFNMDKAQIEVSTYVMPQEWSDDNTVGYLLSKNALVIREMVDMNTVMQNPTSTHLNMWLLRQQIISNSPFEFALKLTKNEEASPERVHAALPYKLQAKTDSIVTTVEADQLNPAKKYSIKSVTVVNENGNPDVNVKVSVGSLVLSADKKTATVELTLTGFDNDRITRGSNFAVNVQLSADDGKTSTAETSFHISKSMYYGQ